MTYQSKSNCLNFSSLFILLLFFQVSHPQAGFSGLQTVIDNKQKILGQDVVLMVANKDTVIYQKAPKLFNARTQALLGHSSQWLTAALIVALADEGKLSLDDKVSQYLPVFEKYGKNYITLRHCISHFTGIQAEGAKALKVFEKKKFASLEEEVAAFAAKEIQTNPGTEFRYSNIGPAIAARVAEVVMKKRFDMLIQQKLFRPLGMRQTTFSTLDASAIQPATGARTTANDYMRFLRMLLNGGTINGQRILSEQAVQALRTVQTKATLMKSVPEEAKSFDFALGAWAPEHNSTAGLLTAPSLGGTLPIVDFCRGYAFLLLLKEETNDTKANVYFEVKEALDGLFPNKCK